MNLTAEKRQTVITSNPRAMAVEVEQTGRGAYATVVDDGEFHGQQFFGSTPRVALDCLMAKLAAVTEEV